MSKFTTSLKYQLPEFVRDEYKTFVSFMELYHQFLEQEQADIASIIDIDTVLGKFVENYKNEINHVGMEFPFVDNKFMLRHIKQFYLSKGTEESYSILFRALFDRDVNILYPEQFTLKSSDGRWNQSYSLMMETVSGDATLIDNKIVMLLNKSTGNKVKLQVEQVKLTRTGGGISAIHILNGGSGYTAINTRVQITSNDGGSGSFATPIIEAGVITGFLVNTSGNSYKSVPTVTIVGDGTNATIKDVVLFDKPDVNEVFINRAYQGKIEVGDTITYGAYTGKIVPSVISAKIISGGSGFSLGQKYEVMTNSGSGAVIKVTKVAPGTKAIQEVQFVKFGIGYQYDFTMSDVVPPAITTSNIYSNFTPRLTETRANILVTNGTDVQVIGANTSKMFAGYLVFDATNSVILGNVLLIVDGTHITLAAPIANGSYSVSIYDSTENITDTVIDTVDNRSYGHILREVYFNPDDIDPNDPTKRTSYAYDYSGVVANEFYSANNTTENASKRATISFKVGAVCKYPGFYDANNGFLSDAFKVQDSRFYQKYSYVIQSDLPVADYKDAVNQYLHPAGMIMFGEQMVTNKMRLTSKLKSILSIFGFKHTDSFYLSDHDDWSFIKALSDDINISSDTAIFTTKMFAELMHNLEVVEIIQNEYARSYDLSYSGVRQTITIET